MRRWLAKRMMPELLPWRFTQLITRDEAMVALGHWSFASRPSHREGVLHLKDKKLDVFFVTLQKTESDYSPTTMYEDYLISHDQFHWQSQSSTSDQSATGQRYIQHREQGIYHCYSYAKPRAFQAVYRRHITSSDHADTLATPAASPSV